MFLSLIKGLVLSFYSRDWYEKMRDARLRFVFCYVLLLVLVLGLIIILRFGMNLSMQVGATKHEIISQLPTMQLVAGNLQTPAQKPYLIYAADDPQNLLAVVDTTSDAKSMLPKLFFAGKHAVYYRLSGKRYLTPYPHVTRKLTPADLGALVQPYLRAFILLSLLVFFVVQIFLIFAVVLLFSWVVSVLLKSLANTLGYKISIKVARNLALCALTPPLLLGALAYLFSILTPLLMVVLLAMVCAYVLWIVYLCQPKQKRN